MNKPKRENYERALRELYGDHDLDSAYVIKLAKIVDAYEDGGVQLPEPLTDEELEVIT